MKTQDLPGCLFFFFAVWTAHLMLDHLMPSGKQGIDRRRKGAQSPCWLLWPSFSHWNILPMNISKWFTNLFPIIFLFELKTVHLPASSTIQFGWRKGISRWRYHPNQCINLYLKAISSSSLCQSRVPHSFGYIRQNPQSYSLVHHLSYHSPFIISSNSTNLALKNTLKACIPGYQMISISHLPNYTTSSPPSFFFIY